jgi:hypothetical protein
MSVIRPSSAKPTHRWLLLAGLIAASAAAGFEVQRFIQSPQDWDRLLAAVGFATLLAYVILLITGLAALILAWFSPVALAGSGARLRGPRWLRWAAIAALTVALAWCYLYSPWQAAWPGPWLQLVFAFAIAAVIGWLAAPERSAWTDGAEIALALALFLYPRVVLELRAWYGVPLVYRGATVLGILMLVGSAALLFGHTGRAIGRQLAAWRASLGARRWILVGVYACIPLLYLAVAGADYYVLNPAIRFLFLLIAIAGLAFLISADDLHLLSIQGAVVSILALIAVSFVARSLLLVVDYPFSLSWSEGNRFYDYSLVFGQDLYRSSGPIANPYGSVGRYALWGVLFVWRGLSIQAHRLWNVLLYTLPPLIVGALLARKLREPLLRAAVVLFVAVLFMVESPLHPPFLVAAALAVAFTYDSSLWHRGIALAAASLYAGLSRWTWIPVAAAWGVLIDLLLYYPSREGSLFQRLKPTLILGIAGLLPGLISGYSGLPLSSGAREYHQPLLWYRLLPNPTFPLGVLFSTILISGPALALLIWWVASRSWKLDWLQRLAIAGALAGFLAAGLVISMKIGGGADLHNLDMYLMTLTLVMVLGLYCMSRSGSLHFANWPVLAQVLLAFMILFPLYGFTPLSAGAARSTRLELLKPQGVSQTLSDIREETERAARQGEVLFMDQRQLLTFGYIQGVQFVPEYEKKYMMDQAMAGSAEYFQAYYQDLARRRFSLIVTEILHTRQERDGDFTEENNAWVKWVSEPTLCFYQPLRINKDVNVELLVPRPQPTGCEAYLHLGE